MVAPLSWLDEDEMETAMHTAASDGVTQTTLDLSNRPLTHASLRLLPETLTCLDLTRCSMVSLEALAQLPRLELINVSYNRLASLDALQHSRGLKVVFARSNRITSLAALESLPVLQSLDLECNALDTLDALRPHHTGSHTAWWSRPRPTEPPTPAPPARRLPAQPGSLGPMVRPRARGNRAGASEGQRTCRSSLTEPSMPGDAPRRLWWLSQLAELRL